MLPAEKEHLDNGVLLKIEDLWKSYGRITGVAGLYMKVSSEEIHGLIGPNGAGKTTTVKCVVGLLKPDKGDIIVFGKDVKKDYGYKRFIGYLPEAPFLPDYLTPKEFLGYIARIRGVEPGEETKRRVLEFMKIFELEDYENRFIIELSKGLKQRLALATVFIHEPKLVILDEPFIGLDPEGQRLVKNLVRKIVDDGGAALICTHMLDMAERFCTHVTIINKGKSIATNSVNAIKKMAGLDFSNTLEEAFFRIVGVEKVNGIKVNSNT
ncbi:MAG: ABC transporter ATP-binding protein [Nitrososphaerota archaeon]|nr:ABC transporter ATP-binding protein [Nitrososphaerota archaeon]